MRGMAVGMEHRLTITNTIFILLTREKGRGAIYRENVYEYGVAMSRKSCLARWWRDDITRVEETDRVKVLGMHPHSRQAGPKIPS